MADTTITVLDFKHMLQANTAGKLIKTARIIIRVGDFGPFTKDFPDDANLVPAIETWKAQQQAAVQTVVGGV